MYDSMNVDMSGFISMVDVKEPIYIRCHGPSPSLNLGLHLELLLQQLGMPICRGPEVNLQLGPEGFHHLLDVNR